MDEGPFRMPRSADRGDEHQPEPQEQSKEEPQPARERAKPVHRATPSHRLPQEESPLKRFLLPGIGAIIVIALAVIGWMLFSSTQGGGIGIDSSKYQAVFFTNGQVYFGKLQAVNDEYMKLTDIYYLQTPSTDTADASKNPQKTDQGSNPTLIKLGSELHGPEDTMIINKDQVLFYENLKKDGKVAESIEKYKKPN